MPIGSHGVRVAIHEDVVYQPSEVRSFLTVQLMKEYPDAHWDGTKKNTAAFQSMKEDLGPVKIM